jgi:hypothetical protein
MALWTLRQSNAAAATGTNPYSLAYTTENVAAGSGLIAVISWSATTGSVTDFGDNLNGLNAWNLVRLIQLSTKTIGIYYFNNTVGGACTVSATLSTTEAPAFILLEFTGPQWSLGSIGQNNSSTATTSPTTGNITPNKSTSLILGAVRGGTVSAGESGWSSLISTGALGAQYIQPGNTTALAATFTTTSSNYAALIAEFEAVPPPVTEGVGGSLVGPYNFWGGGFN